MANKDSTRIMVTISNKNLAQWKLATEDVDVPLAAMIRIAMKEYIRNHKDELTSIEEADND